MTNQKQREMELAKRLLKKLGCRNSTLEPREPPKPDVLALLDGLNICIEVTEFHSDEGKFDQNRGSTLRASEEKKAKKSKDGVYLSWGDTDFIDALRRRLQEKVKLAEKYDCGECDDLWLLTSAQLPDPGALVSTFLPEPFLKVGDLNPEFNNLLVESRYDKVFLHLLMENWLYKWSPSKKWRVINTTDKEKPSDHGKLWFDGILQNPDWLRDPNAMAVEEAKKAIDEINIAKQKNRNTIETS